MKSLPKVATIFALPLIFFGATSFALLASASGVLITSTVDEKITFEPVASALFGSLPPDGVILGESTVSQEARPIILKNFLEVYRSPLAAHSNLILSVSGEFGLDWRLLAAIAGAESTFCRTIPDDSHNCWGWGIHSRGTLYFSSYEEGIRTVARGLKEKFLDDGLTTVEDIMTRYAPVSLENGGSWAYAVNFFMNQLEHAEY
ncbi:hypothetical protein GTO10_02675 [Candidatus Saccharibacteria bacterium]|nr:hypothetical protein [Candidatus Saccharibacteria bacterium]